MLAGMFDQAVRKVGHRCLLLALRVGNQIRQPLVALRFDFPRSVGHALFHERHHLRFRLQIIALRIIRIVGFFSLGHIRKVVHRRRHVDQLGCEGALFRNRFEFVLVFGKIFRHGDQLSADLVPLRQHRF